MDKAVVIFNSSEAVAKALAIEKSFNGQRCVVGRFSGEMDKKVYYEESDELIDTPKVEKKAVKRSSSGQFKPTAAKKIKTEYLCNIPLQV